MSRSENQEVLARHLAAENRHDLAGTLATVHPDCVFEDAPLGLCLRGHRGAERHYRLWWSAFGNTVDGGELHWVGNDRVIGDAVFTGTHRGAFCGIAATGRPIRLPFVVFVGFRDGLLASERFVYDLNGLLAQLGQPAWDVLPVAAGVA
jgi:steroid delta-isomerase-like uncharacterized protein